MDSDFLALLEESKALNAGIFSLIRLQLLSSLAAVSPDWSTYREFKASLQVSDGALYSNLKALMEMGYVKSKTIKLEGKELESYQITTEGLLEWERVKNWLKIFLKCGGKTNESR